MDEVRAIPWNGLNVVSTFAGCGGSSPGYRMAGCRVLWANEFIEAARDTYSANCAPYTILDGRDNREINAGEIREAIGGVEIDILDGSPPCASFSTAGKREKHWGEKKKYSDATQRTDDLFFEFARVLAELQPRAFVAENVSGLVKGTAKGYFQEIFQALTDCGYTVRARLLDAQWCGVPQGRQRIIFIGIRNDLERVPVHPTPLPYRYTVHDVIESVYDRENFDEENPPYPIEPKSTIVGYAIKNEWDHLDFGQNSKVMFQLVKCDPYKPMPCLTATGGMWGTAGPIHPFYPRKFSIHELKLLCSFPADFILTGNYAKQWERLGRSVPPLMMKRIASAVCDTIGKS